MKSVDEYGERVMERSPSPSMLQQAKEELEMLEAQHPNRLHSLKLELNSFIFLHSQNIFLSSNRNTHSSSFSQNPHHKMPYAISSSAATQASSNSSSRKRKKDKFDNDDDDDDGDDESKQKFERVDNDGDRVDEVLKRAQLCLQRIKDLKTNFFRG